MSYRRRKEIHSGAAAGVGETSTSEENNAKLMSPVALESTFFETSFESASPNIDNGKKWDREDVKKQDVDGYLPLHRACMSRDKNEDIEKLINLYPAGLGVKSNYGLTPFGWDYENSPGGFFTEFIKYVVNQSNEVERERTLDHCKNYVPMDILKIGFLENRDSPNLIQWLNHMLCRKSVVAIMVLELYLHVIWICIFVSTSRIYFNDSGRDLSWRINVLIAVAVVFLFEEAYQMRQFYKTGSLLHYWLDCWNWIDISTCIMVILSAVGFQNEDPDDINKRMLMTAVCLQSILFLSYLKKTFFPFSKFVSGVIKIIWATLPFLVVSMVTLFTFCFMYFIQDQDMSSPGGRLLQAANPSRVSLLTSYETVMDKFAGGAGSNSSILDFFFGTIVIIVLLNVLIAVVSSEWETAVAEANASFWRYRLDLILDKTRGWRNNDYPNKVKFQCGGDDLDELFINSNTVGTTTEELINKLSVMRKKKGLPHCVILLVKCFGFVVLGFFTFGVLWPKFFRQILFTPSTPKETDEIEASIETLGKDIEKYKNEVRELVSQTVSAQNEFTESIGSSALKKMETLEQEIAEYRKEVGELSQKVSTQNDLLEQLVKKLS